MNNLLRRWLSVTLLTCLMFSHTIPALASEPEKNIMQTKSGYVEATTEEIEITETDQIDETVDEPLLELPPEQVLPEPCPEEPDQPEADEPSDLLKAPQAEEREKQDEEQPLIETEPMDTELIDTEPADVVYDEEELEAWIELHKKTGGTVYLGASVTITDSMPIYDIYGEITVDTGKYGLVFDGAMLPSEDILITGEGVDTPVVGVRRTNDGGFWFSSWNNHLMRLNVTATGRDGAGGTAMRILAADTKSFDLSTVDHQGTIRSYGEGAIGLYLDVPMEAWCYNIEVFGDNSVAAYAPEGADFYFCKLAAWGKEANAADGNNVRLDCCSAFPVSERIENFQRSLLDDSLYFVYFPIRQYDIPNFDVVDRFTVILLPLSGGSGYEPVYRKFPVLWDRNAYENIDTSVLGRNTVSGCFPPALQGLGLDDSILQFTVEVRDPTLPCIELITPRSYDLEKYFYLRLWDFYDPLEDDIVLWRSDDEGETWWDATWAKDILWEGIDLCFSYDALEHPVWFVLELVGTGNSNTVILSEKDGYAIGSDGGDRTGTDRDGGGSSGDSGGSSKGNRSKPGDVGTSEEGGEKSDGIGADETGSEASADSTSQGNDSQENSSSNAGGSQDSVSLNGGLTADIAETIQSDIQVTDLTVQNTSTLRSTPADSAQTHLLSEDININADSEDHEPSSDQSASPFLPFDPEQSAPNPGFSANAAIILFLVIASLFACALLIMRFLRGGRRHGKS